MSHSLLRILIVATLFAALLSLGNSGGTAANGNFYTGAPSSGGGTEQTCSTCHRGGDFGEPQLAVTFDDGTTAGELAEYVPGQTYTVTVAVGYNDVAPVGYGFSSQFLTLATSPATNVGTPANPSDNARITSGGNGRTYVEHNQRSADSTFTFEWTAPAAGTGEISYYLTGNLVNGANGTGGDNGSTQPTVITLAEGVSSSVRELRQLAGRLFPNPAAEAATLAVELPHPGSYRFALVDASGRTLRQQALTLTAGPHQLPVVTAGLPAGLYTVRLVGTGSRFASRLVVR